LSRQPGDDAGQHGFAPRFDQRFVAAAHARRQTAGENETNRRGRRVLSLIVGHSAFRIDILFP